MHVACSTEKRENALRVSSSAAERRPPPLSGTMVTRLRSVVMLRKVKICEAAGQAAQRGAEEACAGRMCG